MKQITFKELKEIFGCETNNEFANKFSLCLSEAANDNYTRGYKECGDLLRKQSSNIYTKLEEIGFYDDLEEV